VSRDRSILFAAAIIVGALSAMVWHDQRAGVIDHTDTDAEWALLLAHLAL
jgi:hypothetical protein